MQEDDIFDENVSKADYKLSIKKFKKPTDREERAYWAIYKGTTKPENPSPKLFELFKDNGEKYYAILDESISGKIYSVNYVTKTYNGKEIESIQVNLRKNEKKIILDIPFNSKYGRNFIDKLMGIDVNKVLQLKPYNFKDDKGNDNVGISLRQDDIAINSLHTKENPNGKPQPIAIEKNNKPDWDWGPQIKWQLAKIEEFNKKIKETHTAWDSFNEGHQEPGELYKKEEVAPMPTTPPSEEGDGLPF